MPNIWVCVKKGHLQKSVVPFWFALKPTWKGTPKRKTAICFFAPLGKMNMSSSDRSPLNPKGENSSHRSPLKPTGKIQNIIKQMEEKKTQTRKRKTILPNIGCAKHCVSCLALFKRPEKLLKNPNKHKAAAPQSRGSSSRMPLHVPPHLARSAGRSSPCACSPPGGTRNLSMVLVFGLFKIGVCLTFLVVLCGKFGFCSLQHWLFCLTFSGFIAENIGKTHLFAKKMKS